MLFSHATLRKGPGFGPTAKNKGFFVKAGWCASVFCCEDVGNLVNISEPSR